MDTVERVFDLEAPYRGAGLEDDNPDEGNKVSEPRDTVERVEANNPQSHPIALEEERRQARENWLRLRQQTIKGEREIGHERDAG